MKRDNQATPSVNDQAIEWLVRLYSGSAGEEDFKAYQAWRSAGPEHEAAAREAETLWQSLSQTHHARLHRDTSALASRSSRRQPISRKPMAWAAAACLGLLALELFQLVPGYQADYLTSIGERRNITLDDGSVLHLNTDTAISVNYTEHQRQLVLHHGEALFQVRSDPARPFTVSTARGHFQAVGTAFSIHSHDHQDELIVTEGTVAVSRSDLPLKKTRVSAGQGLKLESSSAPAVVNTDTLTATAWQRGKLVFNRRPLAEVIAELNRYQTGYTVLMTQDLASLEITGVFDLDDIDASLTLMANTLPIEITRLPYLTLLR